MARCTIQPLYINLTELASGDPRLGRIDLTLEEWREIPTSLENGHGGQLSLQLVPGRNFQVDLIYGGSIKTLDELTSGTKRASYSTNNSIFHSELLHVVEPGNYRFQSSYPSIDFHPGRLSDAVRHTKISPDIEARKKEVKPELIDGIVRGRDDLELILHDLLDFVMKVSNGAANKKNNYYDFLSRYQQLEDTGSFSGHCKEISTFTVGLLNALGLRAKLLNAFIYETVRGKAEPRIGHSLAEVHVPSEHNAGSWLLVDSSLGNLYDSPRFLNGEDIYLFDSASLPTFSDPTKSAKIKIRYI